MKNKNTHEITNDFLQKHDFINFYQIVSSPQFPWYMVNKNDDNLNFCHQFYYNFNFVSNFSDHVKKILHGLNPEAIVNIYARLTSCKKNITENCDPSKYHTAILFMNTNDSYYMINNIKINSVANSMIIINPGTKYSYNLERNNYPAAIINFKFFQKSNIYK